jgi:hypothetical protein
MMPPPASGAGGSPRAPRPPPPLGDALADAAVQGTNDDATVSKLCARSAPSQHARASPAVQQRR